MQYRILGKSGLRVSELALGTMTFGSDWGWGADKQNSKEQFDLFLENGGNFIDTANRYTEGTSESFIGEFMEGRRDKVVLATKYSLYTQKGDVNDGGNHRKNLVQSIEKSLNRLKTDYIDLLYLHAWDFTTGEQEVMYALEQLVRQGKVLHLGFSDTPAWVVSRCQTIAELRGWSSIIALQVEYSLLERTVERDLTPMAQHLNMGVVAWAPLAGGALTGKYLSDLSAGRLKPESKRLDSRAVGIVTKLVEIAGQKNCSPAQAALAWLRQKSGLVIPLVGARNATQLKESIESLSIVLTDQEIASLNAVSEIDYGFPHTFLASDAVKDVLFGGMYSKIKR